MINEAIGRLQRLLWPNINDLHSARVASQNGAWAAFIIAGMNAAFAILSGFGIKILNEVDIWAMVDVGMFAGFGFGIWKMSRACAVAALVAFILERLFMWSLTGIRPGGVFIIFVFFLVSGVRGTIAHRKFNSIAA